MAERRMFAKTIIDSDAFIDMPLSTQALYFHLSMRADDEGFINNPRKIQRMIGASDDDAKILIAKKFIIPFDSGIVVIKHWKIHNYIQADRFKATVYQDEKAQLELKPNKSYTKAEETLKNQQCVQDVYMLDTEENEEFELKPNKSCTKPVETLKNEQCVQDVYMSDTQVSIDKDSIDKDSIDKDICICPELLAEEDIFIKLELNDGSLFPVTSTDLQTFKDLYPAVDVEQELRNMKGWLLGNPTKRKTKRGIKKFITSWLAREQDKGGSRYGVNRQSNQGYDGQQKALGGII